MRELSVNNNIKAAVIAVSSLTLIAKVFGFAEKIVLAYFFGTSMVTDVYFSSLAFFMSAVFIVKELLSPTLMPNLVRAINESERDTGNLFRIFLYMVLCLGFVMALLFYAFSDLIPGLIAPGFSQEMQQMQASFIKATVPYFTISLVSIVFMFILQAYKKFVQASAVEVLNKLVLLILLTVLASAMGIQAISLALCVSSFLSLLLLYFVTPVGVDVFKKTSIKYNSYFGKTVSLMPPIVIGVVFSHISGLIDNIFASTFSEGSLSQLSFAKKLIDTILLLGPVAIITVLYPNLACHSKNNKKFNFLLNRSLRVTLFIAVPLTFILLFAGRDIISVVFEHGSFDSTSTSATFSVFAVYSCGLIALACEPIIVHAYFAKMDTTTPIRWGIICVFINIVLTLIFIEALGFIGIPLAFVISKTVKVVVLSIVFDRRRGAVFKMFGYVVKLFVVSLFALALVHSVSVVEFGIIFRNRFIAVLLQSGVFVTIYILLTYKVLKIYESKYVMQILLSFRKRNGTK